jgi:D-erythro-7,8-dihydroneopterin triphosphate epimerase
VIKQSAHISIENLRLRTYIGFNPEELEKKQDVIINIGINYSAVAACESDDEHQALDYKVITKEVIKFVEDGRFKLLEKLCSDILDIAAKNPRVEAAEVRVEKPHALRFADSVSVSMSALRGEK